jgi:hypothetical protein
MPNKPLLLGAGSAAAVALTAGTVSALAAQPTTDPPTPGGCAPVLTDGTFPTGPQLRDWVQHGYPSVICRDSTGFYNVFTVPANAPGGKKGILKPAPWMTTATRDGSAEGAAACYLPPISTDSGNGFYDN